MEYTEDADHRELLLHSAYDSDTVRAMERPLLDKGVPLMRMAAQAAAHMAAGMLDDEDLALEDTSIVLLAGAGDNMPVIASMIRCDFLATAMAVCSRSPASPAENPDAQPGISAAGSSTSTLPPARTSAANPASCSDRPTAMAATFAPSWIHRRRRSSRTAAAQRL